MGSPQERQPQVTLAVCQDKWCAAAGDPATILQELQDGLRDIPNAQAYGSSCLGRCAGLPVKLSVKVWRKPVEEEFFYLKDPRGPRLSTERVIMQAKRKSGNV